MKVPMTPRSSSSCVEAYSRSQPFSVLVGTTLETIEPGLAQLALPIKPELLQQHGFVHGGVIAYLADNALTLRADRARRFADGRIQDQLCAACDRTRSFDRGRDERRGGKTQAVCRCDIYS